MYLYNNHDDNLHLSYATQKEEKNAKNNKKKKRVIIFCVSLAATFVSLQRGLRGTSADPQRST